MSIKQCVQAVNIVHARRNICAFVRSEAIKQRAVVIAKNTGMNLHDHTVFARHSRHLGEHLRPQHFALLWARVTAQANIEKLLAFRLFQISGLRGTGAMIAGACAVLPEVGSSSAYRCKIACPRRRVFPALSQPIWQGLPRTGGYLDRLHHQGEK